MNNLVVLPLIRMVMLAFKPLFFFGLFMYASFTLLADNQFTRVDLPINGRDQSGIIHTICQDHLGYIWIGQSNGLYRFDGYDYKRIPTITESEYGISNNNIRIVINGSDSLLWIGTRGGGLNRYNRKTDSYTIFINDSKNKKSISFNDISSLYEDTEQTLWVGTNGGGLNRFHKESETFEQIVDPENQIESASEKILSIFRTPDNVLYVGTWGNGLKKIDLNTNKWEDVFLNLDKYPLNSRRNIWSITDLGSNNIVLGTFGEGALTLNTKTQQVKRLDGVRGKRVFQVLKNKNGLIYLATEEGLETIENGIGNIQSPSGEIRGISFDRDGHLWVGQQNNLWALKKIPKFFNAPQPLSDFNFSTLFFDQQSYLWLACQEQLVKIHIETYATTNYPIPTNTEINMISKWAADTLVLATNEGVLYFKKSLGKFVNHAKKSNDFKNFVRGNAFFATQIKDSTNLVCTLEKLYYGKEGDENYISKQILPSFSMSHYVSSAVQDSDNSIWLGTYGGGLNHLDAKFEHVKVFKQDFVSKEGLSNNFIESMAFDHSGRLWIGSHDGLNLLIDSVQNKFTTYTVKDGLPNNEINSMVVDADGYLWIGTAKGLCRADVENMRFRTFGLEDGLPSLQFLTHSAHLLKDETIVMGTTKGAIRFNPSYIPEEISANEVFIQSFLLFNEEVHPKSNSVLMQNMLTTSTVKLNYNQNYFGINFTSFPFFNKEITSYAYQLKGVDKNWQYTKLNTINYTNVAPGNYILKIKSIIGAHSSAERLLQIVISPPWWKSKVAYWIYLSLAFLTLAYLISYTVSKERKKGQLRLQKYRMKKEHEMSELKIAFFSQVSNELKNPLTLLLNPLNDLNNLLKRTDPDIENRLTVMRTGAFQIKQILDYLVDFKKIGTGEHKPNLSMGNISALLERVCQNYAVWAKTRNIVFLFDINQISLLASFDAGLIAKILGNVLDFFFNRSVENGEIEFKSDILTIHEEQFLSINISDSMGLLTPLQLKLLLEPFSAGNYKSQHGFGLAITNELVGLCNGKMEIKNQHDGLIAQITLPLVVGESLQMNENIHHIETDKPLIFLIIDHAELLTYMMEAFSSTYNIYTCKSAEQAIEVTSEKMPDLFVCDFDLKGIDGLSFYMQTIENKKTENIPFILLSNEENQSIKLEALKAGVYSFLVKPFNIDELLAVVRNFFNTRDSLKRDITTDANSISLLDVEISDSQKELLERVLEYMEKNYQNSSLSVELLCAELEMSRPQLYRKLQTLTGLSVHEFIKSFRLKKAAAFLRSGEQRISDIAYKTGFSDPQHFSKSFKNQFGKSPSQYVAEHKR